MPTSILHNTPMGKYTFYRMSIRVKKKNLQNALMSKYTFYGMSLWANKHFTDCAYMKIYILRNESGGKQAF